jgi:hypothetical protein
MERLKAVRWKHRQLPANVANMCCPQEVEVSVLLGSWPAQNSKQCGEQRAGLHAVEDVCTPPPAASS